MEPSSNRSQAIEEEILRSNPNAVIVRTDGAGQAVRKVGRLEDAGTFARDVDVVALLASAVGQRQQLGDAETLVMTFREGLFAIGRLPNGRQVGVLVDRQTTVGLLINYLHRLLAAETP